jgi:epoxyqueuosine reductase
MPFQEDRCGNCHRCIDACPTSCILPDRTIDAKRCISALTIETKGSLTPSLQEKVGNHVFGCDVCQSVCPWNKRSETADPLSSSLTLERMTSLLSLQENDFRVRFLNTVFIRGKCRGFVRNLCAVLGNLKSTASLEKLSELLASDPDPVIRVSAATAMMSIDPTIARQKIMDSLAKEPDSLVKSELEQLLN